MKKLSKVVSVVFYGLAGLFAYDGYYKMTHYYNSDSFPDLNVNAYVGGDAYNYMINGNYAIAYFILSLICVLIAATILILNKLNNNH